jgi:hypothetical protein
MTAMLRYRGEILGFAGATRFYLVPHIERLPNDHPLVRMACLMALFALQVRNGEVDGPYTDDRAELYARCALIPDDEFVRLLSEDWEDEILASHFAVPTEQVAEKRLDLQN